MRFFIVPLLLAIALPSCTVKSELEVDSITQLRIPLADIVQELAPDSHGQQMFAVGKSEGMTKEYGYPFHQDQYDASIVLTEEEADGFLVRLAERIRSVIEGDGLEVTGTSTGEDFTGYLYHGNGKRGTLDLFVIPTAERAVRILILVTEQPL
jgi:hypothetical protein